MKIYGDVRSGNCYKLKLLCALLALEHDWIAVDIMQGETRSDNFPGDESQRPDSSLRHRRG
jgi:glutathione S-transferase